jgi:hypothetical protein
MSSRDSEEEEEEKKRGVALPMSMISVASCQTDGW